ncbi:MAG: DUF262 domain-containing protein [Endomicrobium sp.]|jgi:uncharacterized protein with ParB-like and HNH nuclease domain|nr:DUF262 domain-containing protein [Endomicrobium sp.]
MAIWTTYRIADAATEIEDEKFVLPVIQRPLVWTEEKMELLFDTLLKGDSFGAIMAIEEEKGAQPLFNYRPFTKDGCFIPSRQAGTLTQQQLFIIDGQQRLQTFYIGLKGSINGKILYFDLFSDYNSEFEFKFENNMSSLPKQTKEDRAIQKHLWYSIKDLLQKLKNTGKYKQIVKMIIEENSISDESHKDCIEENVLAFYENVLNSNTLGISKVVINKCLPDRTEEESAIENRQKIVEMFRRLNDGGTKLSSFELVASILKGFDWRMENFLNQMLDSYQDIGLSQENLIKLVFLLQDNYSKEMSLLEYSDANFAIKNADKIKAAIKALKNFLDKAELLKFYQNNNSSFIPLFFIVYHLFHKDIEVLKIERYFDNYDSGNTDFPLMKKWLYHSLLNGVFRSRGAGWVPYKTGVKKILEIIKNFRNKDFPTGELFKVYNEKLNAFTIFYSSENLHKLDKDFLFFLMYDCKPPARVNDIDHIMPRKILSDKGIEWDKINNIKNYQLIDYSTNRGNKNDTPFAKWINGADKRGEKNVKDKKAFLRLHLIPANEDLWSEDRCLDFQEKRAKIILEKITSYIPS